MAIQAPALDPGLPQELWPVVFANTQEAIVITDASGVIADVNPAFTRITGYERRDAIGNTPRMLKSGYQGPGFYRKLWQCLRSQGRWQGEIWNRARNGTVYPQFLTVSSVRDAGGQVLHYIAIFYDISFLKEQTDRFRHLALHDVLTGLPNRLALNLMLPQAIARARSQGTQLAVCMLDLDDFKPVNDAHGHKAGDDLLRGFAQRLKATLRESDFLARLGGDEFVLLLRDAASGDEIYGALQRIGAVCDTPFVLHGGVQARLRMSLGWTSYPDDDANGTDSPELLLRNADMALYVAKANKGGRASWQHRWGQSTREEVLARKPAAIDGYGEPSRRLLQLGAGGLEQAANAFVERFYAALFEQAESRRLLCALDEQEMAELKRRQGEHLLGLLTPELDQGVHARRATQVGRVHGVLGVSAAMLVDAMGVYLQALVDGITSLPIRVADRASLVQVINVRLKNELKFQVAAIDEVKHAYMQWLSRMSRCALDAAQPEACLDRCVESLCALPGIAAAAWSRIDGQRRVVIMRGAGSFHAYREALLAAGLPRRAELDSAGDDEMTVARAWRNGGLVINPTYVRGDYPPQWRDIAHSVGIRSSAALPIPGRDGPGMLLSIYSRYPAQFDSDFMRFILTELESRLAHLAGGVTGGTAARDAAAQTLP